MKQIFIWQIISYMHVSCLQLLFQLNSGQTTHGAKENWIGKFAV